MEAATSVQCAYCKTVQAMHTARPLTDGRFVCKNQNPYWGIKGCRWFLWENDFPQKAPSDFSYAEHESQLEMKKQHALEQMIVYGKHALEADDSYSNVYSNVRG